MSKKPHKVEEPAPSYAAPKQRKAADATPAPAAQAAEFKRITDKLFAERRELLHKLAQ